MVDSITLDFIVRTPHEVVLEMPVRSLRVLTQTGHVGVRPRMEPMVLAIEAGLVNVGPTNEEPAYHQFVGTAGGLLINDGHSVTLLTPLAVAGNDEGEIANELDRAMHQPNSEMEARAALSKLEGHILNELQHERRAESGRNLKALT